MLISAEEYIKKSPDHWPKLVLSIVKTAKGNFETHLWHLSEQLTAKRTIHKNT